MSDWTQKIKALARRRISWALCVLAGLVMIGAMVAMGAIPNQTACDGATDASAMLRFEWVRTVADLTSLFGSDPCRTQLSMAMDAFNRIDVIAYIPAFTAFQLFAAWGLRANGRLLTILSINLALIAAGCDLLEDNQLLLLSSAMRAGNAPDPAMIDALFWLVRIKFGLLALNGVLLGWLIGRWSGWGWQVARWVMVAGGAIGLAGLFMPQLLSPGIGLAWLTLLIVAIVRLTQVDAKP